MALATAQVQVRDLVMGPGTQYLLDQQVNPFVLTVRADQGGPRAWGHGTWSGAEWANERVVPLRVMVEATDMPGWVSAFQQLAAAFAPVADVPEQVELRFEIGGSEYLLFGRPRMVEPETDLLGAFSSLVRLSFVAQDPRIYSGSESTTAAISLPTLAGGLLVPGVVSSTPPYGLLLDGTLGTYASTPDSAGLDITGDVVLTASFVADVWPPASQQSMIGRYRTGDNQRSYRLYVRDTGQLAFAWSTDGTSGGVDTVLSTVVPEPDPNTGELHARVWLNVDLGGTQHEVTFWVAPTADGPWSQLGAAETQAGTTSVFAGTAPLEIGSVNEGAAEQFAGRVVSATVFAGNLAGGQLNTGTMRAKPRFDRQTDGATSFVDSAGLTWTVNGNASINGFVAGGGLLVPFTINSTLVGGTAPLVNVGTTDTGLLLRIDGPVEQPRVALQRPDGTVQSIVFVPGFDLPAGQWIEIDSAARTALLNGLPQASVRGQAAWAMDPYPLPPGTTTLRFGAADVTAGTLTARWRSAWW